MRKILEVKIIARPANPFNPALYPGKGIYQFNNPDASDYRQIFSNGDTSEGNLYFVQGTTSDSLLLTLPVEYIRELPDAPDDCPAARSESIAAENPPSSGFVSESGLIEIVRALAHFPPKPVP